MMMFVVAPAVLDDNRMLCLPDGQRINMHVANIIVI
jgi:hypothetical protein